MTAKDWKIDKTDKNGSVSRNICLFLFLFLPVFLKKNWDSAIYICFAGIPRHDNGFFCDNLEDPTNLNVCIYLFLLCNLEPSNMSQLKALKYNINTYETDKS